jgi:hypothetical protein
MTEGEWLFSVVMGRSGADLVLVRRTIHAILWITLMPRWSDVCTLKIYG